MDRNGYGLEGAIPDLIAKQIIDTDILPNFKEGNYYRGFDEASDALIRAAAGTYKAPENYRKRGNKGGGPPYPDVRHHYGHCNNDHIARRWWWTWWHDVAQRI
jgi:uncharacterized membrane protein YgcG